MPNSLEDIIIDFKDSIKLEKTQFFKKVIANAYTNAKSIKLSNLQESILNIGLNDIEDKFERIYDMIYAQVYVNFIKFIVYESQLDTPEDYLKQNSLYVNHQRFQKTGDFFSFDF